LLKSDPDTFGWDDLVASRDRTTGWDGVRNYQARNHLRDDMRVGDRVLFYHSQTDKAVVGTAEIVRNGYPDPTQFDRRSGGFDPGSSREEPRWYAVDVRAVAAFAEPVTLDAMRQDPALEGLALLRRGNRLSVLPVEAEQFRRIERLGRPRG
jgi:predicted RNA-binding protein with PUA-like domain